MFRWFALAAFVGCLGISGFYRHRARQQGEAIARRRESPLLIAGRAVLALPLFVAILLYLSNPRWMGWAELALPLWVRWVGVLLGLVAVPSALWVFTSIGRNVSETVLTKRDHALVTTGPYRWVRHPLYTTGAVLLLSIGLMAANWFILLFALLAIVSLRLAVIPLEERELVSKFGDRYRRYMARTGGLLPRWPSSERLRAPELPRGRAP
jgi:protein-S-isoprenylcysteine O-methyltransferase Ste14